jgi:hypothetical protein
MLKASFLARIYVRVHKVDLVTKNHVSPPEQIWSDLDENVIFNYFDSRHMAGLLWRHKG